MERCRKDLQFGLASPENSDRFEYITHPGNPVPELLQTNLDSNLSFNSHSICVQLCCAKANFASVPKLINWKEVCEVVP